MKEDGIAQYSQMWNWNALLYMLVCDLWLASVQKIQTIGECLVGGGSILMISSSFLFDRILKLFTKTKNLEESCPKAHNSFFSVEEEEPLPCLRREMRPGALDLTELNHCPEKQVLV